MKKFALLLLICSGGYLLADGGWIYLKAVLAQQLLEHSWQQTLETTQPTRPWPWADTRVVARLTVPAQGIAHIVLAGDSGRTLAFGPRHTPGSAMPGEGGSVVISGHRDTHFSFLEQLQQGNEIALQTARGHYPYRVWDVRILNITPHPTTSYSDNKYPYSVTCSPFHRMVGG